MKRPALGVVGMLFILSLAAGVHAGSFYRIDGPKSVFQVFSIVHTLGYDGTGGLIEVSLCTESPTIKDALQESIDIWNAFTPMTGNCLNCLLAEEQSQDPDAVFDLKSILLHEIGHCAMGLGHTNWTVLDSEDLIPFSYSAVRFAEFYIDGPDGIRGSNDDRPSPLPGSRLVHWFREEDNNPSIIDGTVIDTSTFSRVINELPGDDEWPASGNRDVAASLGFPDTHSLMYSSAEPGSRFLGLDADAVSTVKMGMAGLDRTAGTADDYTISLVYETDCAGVDINVTTFNDPDSTTLGSCFAALLPIGKVDGHFQLAEVAGLVINFGSRLNVLFFDDFESGDVSEWSEVVP